MVVPHCSKIFVSCKNKCRLVLNTIRFEKNFKFLLQLKFRVKVKIVGALIVDANFNLDHPQCQT